MTIDNSAVVIFGFCVVGLLYIIQQHLKDVREQARKTNGILFSKNNVDLSAVQEQLRVISQDIKTLVQTQLPTSPNSKSRSTN